MFSANIASQFGHLFSCAEETMSFQSDILQILHYCVGIFKVYWKKYDLSKSSFSANIASKSLHLYGLFFLCSEEI
jgi:hypothetical protein